jgi:hypothetical protein
MELVMDASETDNASIVGEACHIVAQSVDGPRGVSPLTKDERDFFANLILLCNVHHKLIDDQPGTYPVERLNLMKAEHLDWVRHQLGFDLPKLQDDEAYANYVDSWAKKMQVDEWLNWTSWLLGNGQPSLRSEMKVELEEIPPWILSRIWPGRYPTLESAFLNFRLVANDLSTVFTEHARLREDEFWQTEKFYRIDEWDPARYKKLAGEFEYHVALIQDLTLELTRAANYVCDMVRSNVLHSYRIQEGVLLVQSGPHPDFSYKTMRVEYHGEERNAVPYPGLETFKDIRQTRDRCFA